jgi:hypothetical protein
MAGSLPLGRTKARARGICIAPERKEQRADESRELRRFGKAGACPNGPRNLLVANGESIPDHGRPALHP